MTPAAQRSRRALRSTLLQNFEPCSKLCLAAACALLTCGLQTLQVLEKLRFLSCLEVSEAVLRESGVVCAWSAAALRLPGSLFRRCLRKSAQALSTGCHCRALAYGSRRRAHTQRCAAPLAFMRFLCSFIIPENTATLLGMQVASLASRVISKWKEAVLAEQPSRKASKHHVTQPG